MNERAVAAKRRRKAEIAAALNGESLDGLNGHERKTRLNSTIALLAARIETELRKDNPRGALLKDLAATAQTLARVNGEQINGKKPGAKDQTPAMPDPTSDA